MPASLIENSRREPFILYPNPATGEVNIRANKGDIVYVYNSTGQLMTQRIAGENKINKISFENFHPAIYLVCVSGINEVRCW